MRPRLMFTVALWDINTHSIACSAVLHVPQVVSGRLIGHHKPSARSDIEKRLLVSLDAKVGGVVCSLSWLVANCLLRSIVKDSHTGVQQLDVCCLEVRR